MLNCIIYNSNKKEEILIRTNDRNRSEWKKGTYVLNSTVGMQHERIPLDCVCDTSMLPFPI